MADESIDLDSTVDMEENISSTNYDGNNENINNCRESRVDKNNGDENLDSSPNGACPVGIIPAEVKQKLSDGIMEFYEPEITSVHERVKEVICNQGVLLDSTQNELTQLKESNLLPDICKAFEDVKVYHKKVMGIKKDMNQLLERAQKIKLRAQKLQIQKEKDELAIALEKERQMIYERELTAKPATDYVINHNS